jgi:hypothetical protein
MMFTETAAEPRAPASRPGAPAKKRRLEGEARRAAKVHEREEAKAASA